MCEIKLETERLIVRPYEEKDLPEYHKLFSDKQNMYFLDDIITNTVEESLESLRDAVKLNETGRVRRFCIALKENDKLIGGCGYDIKCETPAGKIVHMGWFIMPEYQNKGYVTEAAKKVLEFAFLHDNCVRVETGCYKDNIPTQKVMIKAGFRKEAEKIKAQWHDGQMKDRLGFAMNRDEYMEKNKCAFTKFKITVKQQTAIIENLNKSEVLIKNAGDAMDLTADISYHCGCDKFIIKKEDIAEEFFDLKTGLAGEILQKFSNYNKSVAIVGDFSEYTDNSKSLRDFIYESNKNRQILFVGSEEKAVEMLSGI